MSVEVGAVKYKVELDDSGLDQEVSKTESTLSSKLGKAAAGAGKAAAGALAIGTTAMVGLGKAAIDGAKETAAFGDNIDKMSQKIGISAEAFQEWDYIFSQNGADIGILETGMKTLSSAVADAGNGSKSAQEKFKALGLSYEELGKMSQEDIFATVIARLQEMPEGAERTALAADLLGKSAMELGPLLNQTASDTAALKQQAHDLGMIMSDESVKSSAAFTDSMDNLQRAIQGAKASMLDDLMPGLTEITDGFANLVAGSDGATDQIISGIESLVQSVVDSIPQVVETLKGFAEKFAEVAPELIKALADALLEATPQLAPAATDLIMRLAQMIIEIAPQLISVGGSLILELINGIAAALPQLIPTAMDAILTIVETILSPECIGSIIESGSSLLIGLIEGLTNAIPKLIEMAPDIIIALLTTIIENLPKILACGVDILVALIKGLLKAIPELLAAIPKIIGAIWDTITEVDWLDLGVSILKGLIDGILSLGGALLDCVGQILGMIWDGLGNLGSQALQWGADMISGFIDGIMDMAGALWDGLCDIGAGIADFLGFSVPDKGPLAEADTWGPDFVDLFTSGIEDNAHKVTDAVEGLAGDVAMGFDASLDYNVPDIAGYAKDLSASITGTGQTQIEVPVILDGREIARASAWYMGEQLAWEAR